MGTSGTETASRGGRGRRSAARARTGYLWLSTRPLHVLTFLLPLIIAYEVGSVLYLTHSDRGTMESIAALKILVSFFEAFGAATLYLPGVALAVVLLVWHALERDKWQVHLGVVGGMFAESVLWAVPLLILGILLTPDQPAADNSTPRDSG